MKILGSFIRNNKEYALVKHGDCLFSADKELADYFQLTTCDIRYICRLPFKTLKANKKWLNTEFYRAYEYYLGEDTYLLIIN